MRTFHTGGVAGLDITHGLPRVEELFEVRPPKGKAILVNEDGVIDRIEEKGVYKGITVKATGEATGKKKRGKGKDSECSIPRSALVYVKVGDVVTAGDQIS